MEGGCQREVSFLVLLVLLHFPFRILTLRFLTLVLIPIVVPGGFGQHGTEGMMLAIKFARESFPSWVCH